MPQGHSTSCAAAVRTTPQECDCKCLGLFHGVPHSERARALVWDADKRPSYSLRQVRVAKRKAREALASGVVVGAACTDFAVTHAVDELIRIPGAEQDLARDVLGAIVKPLVNEIATSSLSEEEVTHVEKAVNRLHVLCSLCVAVLRAIESSRELAEQLAEEIADNIMTLVESGTRHNPLSVAANKVLRAALHRSLEGLFDLAADPARVKMLQLFGFISCPDVSNHSDVERHCVRPLAGEFVTHAMQGWIASAFPADSNVLHRRQRAKK